MLLVVGVRLGCINHARLSAEAIRASGLTLAGWIANQPVADVSCRDEVMAHADRHPGRAALAGYRRGKRGPQPCLAHARRGCEAPLSAHAKLGLSEFFAICPMSLVCRWAPLITVWPTNWTSPGATRMPGLPKACTGPICRRCARRLTARSAVRRRCRRCAGFSGGGRRAAAALEPGAGAGMRRRHAGQTGKSPRPAGRARSWRLICRPRCWRWRRLRRRPRGWRASAISGRYEPPAGGAAAVYPRQF